MFIKFNEPIKFCHLYDDYFAHIFKYRDDQVIVFPDFDIKKDTEKVFECDIDLTRTGVFTYNDIEYRVARAILSKAGGIVDKIFYGKDKSRFNTMEEAFKKAGLV